MTADKEIRVLLVDDSPTVRAVLRRLLGRAPGVNVAGEASNGEEAIAEVLRLRPDIVVMDIEMPEMNGYVATERIMALRPTPIVVLSSRANRDNVRTAFEALRRGALEVLPKPEAADGWEQLATTLPHLLHDLVVSRAPLGPARDQETATHRTGHPRKLTFRERDERVARPVTRPEASRATPGRSTRQTPASPRCCRLLAIGASTGGPGAVRDLLAAIPVQARGTTLIVQHIAAGFEQGLADWLAQETGRDVKVAVDGETPADGSVRLAPPGAHLILAPSGSLFLDDSTEPRNGHRPSIDELFLSCARVCPRETAAVLLTGMGHDGAEGLTALRRAGAHTLVQDEATSVVFGMPRAALERGGAEVALPPRELGLEIGRCLCGETP